MKRWMACVLFALSAWTAWAGPSDVRKTVEASMVVTGWIEVAPDGSVHGYTIDHPEKIPQVVTDLIKKNTSRWKFHFDEPVSAIQRAKMYLRIKATPVDDQHDSIAISGAIFGDSSASTDYVSFASHQPPFYPPDAVQARVSGTVYLIIRVNREGKVQSVAAEQVNLGVYADELDMRRFRYLLTNSAVEAAKKWTFKLPTTGKRVADPYWDVIAPVQYNLVGPGTTEADVYGTWQVYIPGPRESVPWLKTNTPMNSAPDTVPAGSIAQANSSMHLTTALDGA